MIQIYNLSGKFLVHLGAINNFMLMGCLSEVSIFDFDRHHLSFIAKKIQRMEG